MQIKIDQTGKLVMILMAVIVIGNGCASPKKLLELEQEVNQLKLTVEVLKKSNVEMNMKLDALNNSFKNIEEKVNSNGERLQALMVEYNINERNRSERDKASDFVVDQLYVPDTKSGDMSSDSSSIQEYVRDPHQLYNNAFTHFKTGQFGKALMEFEEFVSRFPEHNLSDNAQYWIGEVYYSQKDYNRALHEFQKVLDLYPLGNKFPDAMLKIGFSYEELREYQKALEQFQKVVERFPDSDAAIKAREQLEIIKSEQ